MGGFEYNAKGSSDPLVSVVVPAYNEEENILDCASQLGAVLSSATISYEIIIVNDGSTDKTLRRAQSISKSSAFVRVLDLGRNFGKRVALREGIRHARGELVAFFDADLQYRPDDLVSMILMMNDGVDFVNGKRDYSRYGVARTVLSHIYNRLVRLLFRMNITDSNCGVKVLKRSVAQAQRILDYGVPLFVPLLKLRGFKSKELPVHLRARRKGESKYFKDGQFLGGKRNIQEVLFHLLKLMSLIIHAPLELRRRNGGYEPDVQRWAVQGNWESVATRRLDSRQAESVGHSLAPPRPLLAGD